MKWNAAVNTVATKAYIIRSFLRSNSALYRVEFTKNLRRRIINTFMIHIAARLFQKSLSR